MLNHNHSSESKNLISKKLKKSVNQYDISGILICEWNSAKDASLTLNMGAGYISECCREKRDIYRNYI